MKKLIELATLFVIGGAIYYGAEMLIRGRSHWSMAVAGGICFLAIGGINEILDYETPFLLQMLYGAIAVTATEFIFCCESELKSNTKNVWGLNSPAHFKKEVANIEHR